MISPVAHIVVAVADMGPVEKLWCGHFGLELVARSYGPDQGLSRIWGLADDAIAGQLLLRTPGAQSGWLHFVQFRQPGRPVREGAKNTDLCPKNLDVNCVDIESRVAELGQDGFEFRSEVSDYSFDDISAREVQMPAHDDTNVVLIEVMDWPISLSSKNYGGVSSFVITVPDTGVEAEFFTALFGHEQLMHHRISGEAIEKVIGLPPGAALDMRVLGDPEDYYGRLELITYEGLRGENLFPLACPPALGALLCRFAVANADALLSVAAERGWQADDYGNAALLFGKARLVSLRSPAGFTLEAFQLLPD
jgi:catechol 2,3-dioxygenase-like lactoylglutathione lyase family enzyme